MIDDQDLVRQIEHEIPLIGRARQCKRLKVEDYFRIVGFVENHAIADEENL